MPAYDLVNGGALLGAVIVALFGPRHTRASVLVMGGLLLVNWHQYATSWPDGNAVSALFWKARLVVPANEVWLAFDGISAAAGVYAWLFGRSYAGLVVYAAATAMVILHLLRWDIPAIDDRVYYQGLEWLFRGQVLALYLAGGKGFAEYVGSRFSAGLGRLRIAAASPMGASARVDSA